jgi:hypothetical protein
MLVIVMACHNRKELERFQLILDHWEHLVELNTSFQFLFVGSMGKQLRSRLPHRHLDYQDSPGLKRFQCVSHEWATVARFIEESVDCTCWFWWEWDVLPVRRDCFGFLLQRWTNHCRIMGYHVKDNTWGMRNKINGVAFYARDYWSFIQPVYNDTGTFDTRVTYDPDGSDCVVLNPWYGLCHHEHPFVLTPALRLVHGIKNDTLFRQIVHGEKLYPVVSEPFRRFLNRVWQLQANLFLQFFRRAEK